MPGVSTAVVTGSTSGIGLAFTRLPAGAGHAVAGLTKTLAREGAEKGVKANAICPGYVLTQQVNAQNSETAKACGFTQDKVIREVLLAAQPTKSFVQPGQIGALAAFLCSPAASQITGTALPVDGGWTAH